MQTKRGHLWVRILLHFNETFPEIQRKLYPSPVKRIFTGSNSWPTSQSLYLVVHKAVSLLGPRGVSSKQISGAQTGNPNGIHLHTCAVGLVLRPPSLTWADSWATWAWNIALHSHITLLLTVQSEICWQQFLFSLTFFLMKCTSTCVCNKGCFMQGPLVLMCVGKSPCFLRWPNDSTLGIMRSWLLKVQVFIDRAYISQSPTKKLYKGRVDETQSQ